MHVGNKKACSGEQAFFNIAIVPIILQLPQNQSQ